MLNDIRVKNAKPKLGDDGKTKASKLKDRGDGLYLYVSAQGARSWRFDFRHGKKRQTVTYGKFPELSLADARTKHDQARGALAKGDNPAVLKQRRKLESLSSDDFKTIAEQWFSERVMPYSKSWQENCRMWLDLAYPYIGRDSIKNLGPAELLAMLRAIEKKKNAYAAESVRKTIALVFDYAIQNLRAETNHARSFAGVIEVPEVKTHPHIRANELPAFLKAVDDSQSNPRTKLAARLLVLLFCRKNELLKAKWTELDVKTGKLEVPAERMKNGEPHVIPLAPSAIELFNRLKECSDGSEFIFHKEGDLHKSMGESTLNAFFDRIGYAGKLTPHGLRSTASTALNESGFRHDVIERQLSHVERDQVRRAYNKADYLAERLDLMKFWADLIDSLCAGGQVIAFKRGQAA